MDQRFARDDQGKLCVTLGEGWHLTGVRGYVIVADDLDPVWSHKNGRFILEDRVLEPTEGYWTHVSDETMFRIE
jgi:hypothetical protein